MPKKKKEDFEDDGRVIADMNVDGMPWNNPKPYRYDFWRGKKNKPVNTGGENPQPEIPPLTKSESIKIALNAMLASLVLALIFAGAAALFILFCTNVWLKH